jgi:hypothetical protein
MNIPKFGFLSRTWDKINVMKKSMPYLVIAALAGAGVLAQSLFNPAPQPIIEDDSSIGPCAYTWAYHDADELSALLDAEVKAIDPTASAHANFYGEDCAYADGSSTFSALETDFYIRIPVNDLTDEEALGIWMAQILQFTTQIPQEQIQGNFGFVEFWFEKSDNEQIIVRVPIQPYKEEAQDKNGAELFKLFFKKP